MAELETFSQTHQAEWRSALHFLLLLIYHERSANEREELFGVVKDSVSRQHREEVDAMVYSSAQAHLDEGRKEGLAKGRVEGRAETLLEQLECRFGPLPAQVTSAVRALPPERLREITRKIFVAESLADLNLE